MPEAPKPALAGFGLANYRSFDEDGFVVDEMRKINVFIGKNNSGKSNVLRAVRLLKRINSDKMPQGEEQNYRAGLRLKPEIDSHRQTGTPPSATAVLRVDSFVSPNKRVHHGVSEGLGEQVRIRWNTASGEVRESKALDPIDDDDLRGMHDLLSGSRYTGRPRREQLLRDVLDLLLHHAVASMSMFERLIFVENFREIRPGSTDKSDTDTFNGFNVIGRLREMQHPKIGQEAERTVFQRIESFVRDLLAEPKLAIEIPNSDDAIYISMHGKRLPLASYGTGLHQLVILCAALAMHDNYVVCIEEPEIHIHPELQRKFLRFIAEKTSNRYFITTHSNVFLDFRPDVAIYHVTHDGVKSTVTPVDATGRARDLLADLGYKASDLLQANCMIWVEGPSDRVYLNKWLSLVAPDLVEGIHYAITFYGGKVLAHFAAVDEPADDLVEVLRINQRAIFVMDRDSVKPDGRLNATKERIREEIGDSQCWVTEGREVENYLRSELLSKYLTEKCGSPINVTLNADTPVEEAIASATRETAAPKIDYARAKPAYAREICERMTLDDLNPLDLRDRLVQIVDLIRKWNHMCAVGPAESQAPVATEAQPARS